MFARSGQFVILSSGASSAWDGSLPLGPVDCVVEPSRCAGRLDDMSCLGLRSIRKPLPGHCRSLLYSPTVGVGGDAVLALPALPALPAQVAQVAQGAGGTSAQCTVGNPS